MSEIDFGAALKVENGEFLPPAEVDPFDLAPIRASLSKYADETLRMSNEARELEVKDNPSLTLAVEMASQSKRLFKAIEDARKGFVDQPGQFVKAINNLAKGFQQPLMDIEDGLKRKIGAHKSRIELERRQEEARIQEETRKLQAKLDAEVAAANEAAKKANPQAPTIEAPRVEVPVVMQTATITRTAEGSASTRKSWEFEIVDALQVPREFMVVDEKLIRQAVKNGVRTIPGVRIFEDEKTVIRA